MTKIGEMESLNNPDNKPPNVKFGDVTWIYDREKGSTHAANFDSGESVISYSLTSNDGVLSTMIQPIEYGQTYDATSDLKDFGSGEMSIVPGQEDSEALGNPPTRKLLSYVGTLFIGKVALTRSISFEKTNNGFKIDSQSILDEVSINYKDKEGNDFTLNGKANQKTSDSNDNSYVAEIPFPNGSSHELPLSNLSISITMPTPAFMEMTREHRWRLKSVEEVPLLQSFLPSNSSN
ncbi:hypothetical protein [Phormidium sp. CCY1219]|uniref:hypothetical protein n=1 Tax=Phormidium sp. CCY1219 TaxID=2886104 RepID=UPI002D1F0C8A|nr:hypothetical protein [Phormidium sp. CCY1219]MEB3828491.1 hypothetical protein [Phormidium sp. CCY1219]